VHNYDCKGSGRVQVRLNSGIENITITKPSGSIPIGFIELTYLNISKESNKETY